MDVTNATSSHEVDTTSDLGAAQVFSEYAREYKSPGKLDVLTLGVSTSFTELLRTEVDFTKRKLNAEVEDLAIEIDDSSSSDGMGVLGRLITS
jgi:hypothetical protein